MIQDIYSIVDTIRIYNVDLCLRLSEIARSCRVSFLLFSDFKVISKWFRVYPTKWFHKWVFKAKVIFKWFDIESQKWFQSDFQSDFQSYFKVILVAKIGKLRPECILLENCVEQVISKWFPKWFQNGFSCKHWQNCVQNAFSWKIA